MITIAGLIKQDFAAAIREGEDALVDLSADYAEAAYYAVQEREDRTDGGYGRLCVCAGALADMSRDLS